MPNISRSIFFLAVIAIGIVASTSAHAQMQMKTGLHSSTTPQLHYDFPFQTMWDDAVLASAHTGKPALAFDLDLDDTNSVALAQEIIASDTLQKFIRAHFEPAMNDFATDPPPTVGLDSLRNLGWRLSGLEKDYDVLLRPTMIVIGADKKEMDRITLPVKMSATDIEAKLTDILEGRNTLQSMIMAFWRDTNSIVMREQLINMFEERSKYDSVLYHLQGLSRQTAFRDIAQGAALRYAYLRLQVEGATEPIEAFMATLGTNPTDSQLHYDLLDRLLDHYDRIKKHDSANVILDRIMVFTRYRDPDLLNDYAWNLATYGKNYDTAWRVINEAISKKGNDPDYFDTRALVNGRLQRPDDAIRDEETAISYATKDNQPYFQEQLKYYRKLKEEMAKVAADNANGLSKTSEKPQGKNSKANP